MAILPAYDVTPVFEAFLLTPQPVTIDDPYEPACAVSKALFTLGMIDEARRADRCRKPRFWTCNLGCVEAEHWHCELKFCDNYCAAARAVRDAEEFLKTRGPTLRQLAEFFTLEVSAPWQPALPTRESIAEFSAALLRWLHRFADDRDGTGTKYRISPQPASDGVHHRLVAKILFWGELDHPKLLGAPGKLSYSRHKPDRLREQLILTLRMDIPTSPETQAAYEQAFTETRSVRTAGRLTAPIPDEAPTYPVVDAALIVSEHSLTSNDPPPPECETTSSPPDPDEAPCFRRCRKHGAPMTEVERPPAWWKLKT